ncbi:MAG: hypothetical protein C0592_12565 [Marinilabiliales bacterium]|nr:MAG: hypothetical protein C0592_12565 [Marinilabiliales bacterium]
MKLDTLIFYIVVTLILLAGFRILSLTLRYVVDRKRKLMFLKYLPLTESLFWMVYLILSAQYFIQKGGSIHTIWIFGILLVILAFFSWFAFRDIIAGIVWKANKKFNLQDTIKIGDFQGKIQAFHHRNLEIMNDNEESIIIPYTRILNSQIIKTNPTEMILSYSFKLQALKEISTGELIQKIRYEILNLPWSSVKNEPKIKALSEETDRYFLEITVYSMDKDYFYKIENHIKKKFGFGK